MTSPRLLRVRCTRWDQVEAFLTKKLRPDGRLSMKVPFTTEPGVAVTLAIELPNQIVVSLDGVVGTPAERDRPDAAVVVLTGARAAIDRLSAMLADARGAGGDGDVAAALAAREAELVRLRQQAAHEVLGTSRGPSAEELRRAWRHRLRRDHPDVVARLRSSALRGAAEEAMIHITRAYERMRATVCADRHAVIAGTSVRTSVGATEIEAPADGYEVVPLTPPVADTAEPVSVRPRRMSLPPPSPEATAPTAPASLALDLDLPSPPPPSRPAGTTTRPPPAPPPATTTVEQSLRQARSGPGDRFVRAIRDKLAIDDAAAAAHLATAAAQVYPRDRRLAALVEVAAAQAAAARGDRAAAIDAVRAALAIDADADEARRILAALEHGIEVTAAVIGDAYR